MITIALDSSKLDFALTRLALAAKVDLGMVIKEEGRYIVKTLMKFTPPKSNAQGKNAIAGDIGRLAVSLESAKLAAKGTKGSIYESLAKMVRKRKTQKINDMMRNPRISFYGGRKMIGSESDLAAMHKARRNNYGRIGKDQMMMAYSGDVKSFRKNVQSRVGWTVSGWIPAAKATGAKWKVFADKFGTKSGSQASNFGQNPFITAVNKQVKIPNYQRMVDGAISSRIKTTNTKISRILANKAVNLGFVKVDGSGPIEQVAA